MSIPFLPPSAEADERAEIIFFQALKKQLEEREAFLSEECGTDTRLRAEVDGLLRDHEKAGSFLSVDAPLSPQLEAEFARHKPDEPGEKIGPYKLLQQIGEGGFGVVWMAEQEKPVRRRVALKIIKLGMDTKEVIARFEQERQAFAVMEHPNIAKIFDAGVTQFGRPFFVMELVRGIKITEYCDQSNLPTADRLKLFIAVCNAVQHAHQKGIIHRDLKPSNVLVTLHDGVPVPKVIDFGVAKATQQQRLTDLTVFTQFEQMIGTPLYMSPEQAEMSGLDIDTRSDIYSLGVLLYELLTGRTPFDPEKLLKQGLDEIRRAIREDEPQKPSHFVSTMAVQMRTSVAQRRASDGAKLIGQIRGDLDWIVMKALEKDRTRRYETANGLARDIERHLESVPVHARPATAAYRLRRWARRNRLTVGAGAAVVLALLVGLAGFIWQAVQTKAALSDLRESAPAFAAMARTLVSREEFEEGIAKLDVAIRLRPDVADYLLKKADLLQSQLRFGEAAPFYREVLQIDAESVRAKTNATLSDKLAREAARQPKLSRQSLVELFRAMTREQRSAAEMMRVGKLLGVENKLLLSHWLERLKDLPISPDKPLTERLTVDESGLLALDLSSTEIADLTPLHGMPLTSLVLSRCEHVTDLHPLRGMPLGSLNLVLTGVVNLAPLKDISTLTTLVLTRTKVSDLSPLHDLALKSLELEGTLVTDLAPLTRLPLERLNLRNTRVVDVAPLQGIRLKSLNLADTRVRDLTFLAAMPLTELDCGHIPASDFSPLAKVPLQKLVLNATPVGDLSFLRGMPLKTLSLDDCVKTTGLQVLAKIKSLEVLTLPWFSQLSVEDFKSIGALRDHPALKQIEDDEITMPSGVVSQSVEGKKGFWAGYDAIVKTFEARALAEALARQGRFSESAKLLRDHLITHTTFDRWVALGSVLLASGDHAGYQATCREMMQRFRRLLSGDECSVRLSLLSPDSSVPMAELRKLMPHVALVREDSPFLCYYLLTNGLLEYRDRRYTEAIELLRRVKSAQFPWTEAAANVVLSMAFHQRSDLQTARIALDRARVAIADFWPNGHATPMQAFDWFYTYLLLQEAQKLIAGSGVPSP